MKNNNMWLTKLINQNSKKTLKLNIDGSKLELSYLRHENNNTWLTKLTKIIINYKIGYKWIKIKNNEIRNAWTHSN